MTYTRQQIVDLLILGHPVSIIRFGDGESIVLNSTNSYKDLQLCSSAVMERQLGYSPSIKDIEAIRSNLIEAYSRCDIIGVPMHKHAVSSHWTKAADVLNKNVPLRTNKICDIDIAYQMLEDGSYDRLLQNRHVLNYISCRDLDEGFKNKWNVGIANRYQISPEMKFTSGYEGDPHYPTQFNKISRWLEVMTERFPKSLLLVGAGVVGKIYCNWWRDRGGVAMDIGGVFDIFYGKVTRGPERGLDKDDPNPIHKL